MGRTRFDHLSRGLRRERGTMNKGESDYALTLDADPLVVKWWHEPFSLRLSKPEKGQPARYTPDFMVLMEDGLTYIDDVKVGGGFDDFAGIVRAKCAAEAFPLWIFRLVIRQRKKDGGGFKIKEV